MLKDFVESGKYFIKDQVVINNDQDQFSHEDIAKNMKNIIDLNDAPFSIAITGEWGLGKSSILEILKNICENSPNSNNYKFCDINAWKYEKEAIRKSFLKNIYSDLNGKKTSKWDELIDAIRNTTQNEETKNLSFCKKISSIFKSSAKIFTQIIGYALGLSLLIYVFGVQIEQFNAEDNFWVKVLFPIVAALVISIVQLFNNVLKNKTFIRVVPPIESTDEYEELFSKRKKELLDKNANLKIIVVVDDLDRLCPQKMVEALDAIKAFEGCIFIVPFDEQILKNALEDKKVNLSNNEYMTITGELFLEKMFQFKIPLHPMIQIDIRKHAKYIITKQTPDLYSLIGKENLNDVLDILIHTGVSNPRKLKKIINVFANNILLVKRRELAEKLNKGLLSDNEGIRLVAKLSVLQADFSEFYKILSSRYDYIDDFLEDINKVENFELLETEELRADYQEFKFTETAKFINFKYNYKNELIKVELKREYIHLYNFLNATNDISLDKINSFIYMAQSSDAYALGDKTTREIIDAITSNSIIPVKNAFMANKANISTIESLILNSLTSHIVKHRIGNTIYCLTNSLTEYNSIDYLSAVGGQIKKLLAVKKLNSIRLDLDCLFIAIKKSNSDGYNLLIKDIIAHLINDDIKYMSSSGKEMNSDKINLYILNLYKQLISLAEDIAEVFIKQCKNLSEEILKGNNKYLTGKQFLDECILENGGSNFVFIDKRILLKGLTKIIIDKKNDSIVYISILKELLEYFYKNDVEEVSETLYNLIVGKVADKDTLGEVLKYSKCITEENSNDIIQCLHLDGIYKEASYANIVVELISELQWSNNSTEFVDNMATYMHKVLAIDVSKGLLAAIDKHYINEMNSFNTMFFTNLLTLNQYFHILGRMFVNFNAVNKATFFSRFIPYIENIQGISKETSFSVQEVCQSLIKVDEARQKIIDAVGPTLATCQQYYSNAPYQEWVKMNILIFEICSINVDTKLIESYTTCTTSVTSLSTELVDSVVMSFNNIFDDASDVSKIKMVNFIVLNITRITNISSGLDVIRKVLADDVLKEKFATNTDDFIKFIKDVANKNLFEGVKIIIDYNIPLPNDVIGVFIDNILLDSNYNDQNKKLLSLLVEKECDNSEEAINLIEDILKRDNSSRLDEFVLQIFNSPQIHEYELFKKILYSDKIRNTLEAYNILNLAKAFEGLFSKMVKGDLICKILKYTDDSYEIILSRIETMYQPILKNRELKKVIANELVLLIKRIGDDEVNKEVVINFAKENGLSTALRNSAKEHDIKLG